jgi:Cytochrome P460
MTSKTTALLIGAWTLFCTFAFGDTAITPSPPLEYTREGLLKRPEHYREWVFLTAGFDMSYSSDMQMGQHTFDNVFVDRQAYRSFLANGTWPDRTALVIENRGAEGRGSINKNGHYQGTKVAALEVHLKDEARYPGKWAFFEFDGGEPAKIISRSEACYSCHAAHAAVDTTFVQFYPTLLPIAQAMGTLSAEYRRETMAEGK